MNLQDLGQLFWIGIAGTSLTIEEREFITSNGLRNVILFKRNVESIAQVRELATELYGLGVSFIGVDEEGGTVSRFRHILTPYPSAAVLGAAWRGHTNNQALVSRMLAIQAEELRLLGINWNFSPILDIRASDADFIGSRAFDTTPHGVAELAILTAQALAKEGIVATGKHFPGHGDTIVDSHVGLPTKLHTQTQLENRELIPFKALISAGIPTLMTAHIRYPSIDPEFPATLSHAILTQLLRNQLGFTGVCVSDDLEMGAVEQGYTTGDAIVQAALAGCDMFIISKDFGKQLAGIAALRDAAANDTTVQTRIAEAIARVQAVQRAYPPITPQASDDLSQIRSAERLALVERLKSTND